MNEIKFIFLFLMTGVYSIVQLIVGILYNNLTLQADSFHMISDTIAIIIAYTSFKLLKKENKNSRLTYGWIRIEIIGALINSVFLLSSCLFLMIDVIQRYIHFKNITLHENYEIVFIIASIGLLINIVGFFLFHPHHKEHSHNMKAMFLHIIGDLLGSIMAIVNACIMYFGTSSYRFIADPIFTTCILIYLVYHALPMVYSCIRILIHQIDDEIDLDTIEKQLSEIDGIVNIHDIHIFELARKKHVATIHVQSENPTQELLPSIEHIFHNQGIHSTTIQIEKIKKNNKCTNVTCNANCEKSKCCV